MTKSSTHQQVAGLLGTLLLAGCASTIPPKATYESLGKELDAAAKANAAQQAKAADVTQALLPPLLTTPAEDARKAVEPRFDLAVNAAPAAQVFMAIVSGTRYSMLVHPEVKGELTVNLKNVTVKEALDTLRDLYGYEYKQDGTRISILPNTLQTHFFQVNYLAAHRNGMSEMRVTSGSILGNNGSSSSGSNAGASSTGSATQGQESSRLTTNVDNNFWTDLNATLAAIVGKEAGREVIINKLSGMIVVRGFPVDIRNVKQYLEATQLIIDRQVMLEAKILEVQLHDGFQTGVNWSAIGTGLAGRPFALSSNLGGASFPAAGQPLWASDAATVAAGTATAATAPLFLSATKDFGALNLAGLKSPVGLAFQTDSFATLLSFLETQGDIQVLSSPRIATLNNQKAVLKVGSDDYFVTGIETQQGQSSGTGTSVSYPVPKLSPLFAGIALDVTPQIDDDNNIVLHVHPSVSTVSEKQKVVDMGIAGTLTLPMASSNVNETDSIVRVQDGRIVAIGGLFTQEQSNGNSGLPGVSGKSFWGDLLGQRSRSQAKREIVLLIKPTIIQNAQSWDRGLDEVRGRLSGFSPRLQQESAKP